MTKIGSAKPLVLPPRMSTLDKYLPVWIGLAMITGLLLGRFIAGVSTLLTKLEIGGISVPIALGLLVMIYPVLAKVRYDRVASVTGDKKLLISSLILNWLVGPALMFALAWIFLPDLPEFRTGLIIVGLARCIAMVVIWNDLACGDREATAVLVAINSIFQVVAFSFLGWFYLTVLPGWLGLDTQGLDVSMGQIALNVIIFLGLPLIAGFASRNIGEKRRGRAWYEERFLPRVSPWALYGLLFTVVLLFALQGEAILRNPLDVVRIAIPLLIYFAVMWFVGMSVGKTVGLNYQRTAALAFSAAGNNFELAIAVAIGTFGATSGQALAGVVGPLIEVPVLVGLAYVSLTLAKRWFKIDPHVPFEKPETAVSAPVTTNKPSVIFVCVHNAGRSQMAAGFLRHLAGDHIEVRSAGSMPATDINPVAVAAMLEVDIDITSQQPKALTDEDVEESDVVITMGCGDACPFYPGKRYEDWKLDDPAGKDIDSVRSIRDDIHKRVENLISSLL